MTLVDYVECIDLYRQAEKYRATWRRHTRDRVFLASRLAECYAREKRLRYCSKTITRNYRRLEDYSKAIEIIDAKTGYGKLIEITIYIKYESRKKRSWDREFEIRIYICVPLHITCKVVAEYYELFISGSEADWILTLIDTGAGVVQGGCREMICEKNQWCNKVCRCDLKSPTEIEIYDMIRGYTWEYTGPPWIQVV